MENRLSVSIDDHIAIEPTTIGEEELMTTLRLNLLLEARRYSVVKRVNPIIEMVPDVHHADSAETLAELGAAYHSAPEVPRVRWGSFEVLNQNLSLQAALASASFYSGLNNPPLPVYLRLLS